MSPSHLLSRAGLTGCAWALFLWALVAPTSARVEPTPLLPPVPRPVNQAPIAYPLSLSTYKNVAVTGWLASSDPEDDRLTYQLTSTPARGSVALSEEEPGRFVFTPYENKTGRDSFTYVAVDAHGNLSNPARVSLHIQKKAPRVTYSDMEGNGAHLAAVRLAQEGILTGICIDGSYFFQPDQTLSRSQFLSMAMAVAGQEVLQGVDRTGFADDESIPTWSKGYVAGALRSGSISGSRDGSGGMVFRSQSPITCAEAASMLHRLLDTDTGDAVPALAPATPPASDAPLTRAQAALLLHSGLELVQERENNGWFTW